MKKNNIIQIIMVLALLTIFTPVPLEVKILCGIVIFMGVLHLII